ncbi:hypothetical protein EBR96_02435, partial [bacterium]|nr:hypothetical protein [bacterium]
MILFSYRTIAMSTHRSAPDNRESKQEQVKKAWNSLSQHLSFLITQETLSVQEAQWIQQLESTFKEPINALSDNRKTRDAYVISTIALLAAVPLFSKKSFGYIVNSIATAANIAKKTPEYFYYGHADYPRYNPEDSLMYQAGITAMLFSPILLILAAVFHFKSYAKAPLLANLAKLKCRADALLSKVPQDTDPSDCFEDGSIKLLFTPEPTLIDAINSDEKSTFEIGTVHRSEKSENYQYVRISDDDRSQKKDLRLLLAELPLSDQTIEDQHPEKVAHTGVAADDKPGIPVSKAKKIKSAKA